MIENPDGRRGRTNSRAEPSPHRNHLAHTASHARNANAIEIEIDFPVAGVLADCPPNLRYFLAISSLGTLCISVSRLLRF